MADPKVTYESLQQDPTFLRSAYHSLRGLGENVSEDPKDIIDTFLTKRRYFDTNVLSTYNQGTDIEKLSDDNITNYSYALDQIKKMPDFYEEGGAPVSDALIDFGTAGVLDPTNLVSLLAGFFTAGAGSAAVLAGKEGAKAGVKAAIKARLKGAIGKRMLGVYAAEGTAAAGGGGTQEYLSQGTDMKLGRRKEGDYDIGNIALQGLAEGILSPIAGAGFNVIGGSVIDATKPLVKNLGDVQAVANTTNWLKNNVIPIANLDEVSVRLTERATGETRPIQEAVEKLSLRMDDIFKEGFDTPDGKKLVNAAMEGDVDSLNLVKQQSPEMGELVETWFDYVRQAQDIAKGAKYGSKGLKEIYSYDPTEPYNRKVYEKFSGVTRGDLDEFLDPKKNPQNSNIKEDVLKLIMDNPDTWGKKSGVFDDTGNLIPTTKEQRDRLVKNFIEELYQPVNFKKSRLGVLKAREDIPEVIQQIYGVNFNPGVRALETVKGVVDSSMRIRLASSLGDSLLQRGEAKIFRTDLEAEDAGFVPFITTLDPKNNMNPKNSDAPFSLREDLPSETLTKLYVPKEKASIIKLLAEGFDGRSLGDKAYEKGLPFVGDMLNLFSGIQGYIKKNKTVNSLWAQARNALGAVQYTIATGNGRGLIDGIKLLGPASKERRQEISDAVSKLGLKGSQADLNQIMTRIGDLDKITDKSILKKLVLNIATGGTPFLEKLPILKGLSKVAQKTYMASDDLGKISSFLRERKRSQDIWDARPEVEKQTLRDKYFKEFNITDDAKLLDEEAVSKVMNILPVYSRLPKILEKSRGLPIVGNFTAFSAENLRNKYNLFKLAGEEIQQGAMSGNSELLKSGANRLVMQSLVSAAPSVVAYTYNQLNGTDKVVDAIRESSPAWTKNHALMVRQDKKNKKYYVTDLSYNNPDQYALDFIMPFMIDAANGMSISESLDRNFSSMITQQASTFLDPSLAVQVGSGTINLLKAMNNGEIDNAGKLIGDLWKLQESGIVKMGREMGQDFGVMPPFLERNLNSLYFGEDRKRFEDSTDLSSWFAKHGVNAKGTSLALPWTLASKEREFDPKKNMAFTTRTLMRNANNDRKLAVKEIESRLLDKAIDVDFEAIAKEYDEALAEDFEAFKQIKKLINSYKEFMPSVQLNRLIYNDKEAIPNSVMSKNGKNFLRANKYGISSGDRLSNKKELFKKIRQRNPNIDLPSLRRFFSQIERRYDRRSLATDEIKPIEIE
tara:strand:+ start:1516 stop:5217 length:3702 start_codon:yes stop_codon:yes gene_type:complete